ncbi:MAG: dUTP diphosphatase [Candidatus Melainabacteria bacterium]|nr:dUTP diphosphatase [Candidatus Melainabacteria bacterium]
MSSIKVKFERLPHCHEIPKYATPGAAGMDLTLASDDSIEVGAGKRAMLPTGVKLEIPVGYEAQIRPRSGLAAKHGISLTNCVGTIDCDYRGEVKVLIINHGEAAYTFTPGERIAQMVIVPVPTVELEEVDSVAVSERGEGGFGSTGKTELVANRA